jgi:hypothetical protein
MEPQLLEIPASSWHGGGANEAWINALEAGRVLYLPHLAFSLNQDEQHLLTPDVRDPKFRNISLDSSNRLKGAVDDPHIQNGLTGMIGRFREQAQALIHSLCPRYAEVLRLAPTSYRPMRVEARVQSIRADDRRLHVDAFPSRPNRGERILRVFSNINPHGLPRVWRIGEPFELVAKRFLPHAKRYVPWQASMLNKLGITKSFRTEYDHLMLQLHDAMKADPAYQQNAGQITMPFPAGSTWVCFSDQTSHAVMSGQFMLEQTLHFPAAQQYDPDASPLAILSRLTGRRLV